MLLGNSSPPAAFCEPMACNCDASLNLDQQPCLREAGSGTLDMVTPLLKQWLDQEIRVRILDIDGKLARLSDLLEQSLAVIPRAEQDVANMVSQRVQAEMVALQASAPQDDAQSQEGTQAPCGVASFPRTESVVPEQLRQASHRQSVQSLESLTSHKAQELIANSMRKRSSPSDSYPGSFVKAVTGGRGTMLGRIWSFLDEPGSSRAAGAYAKAQAPLAVTAVLVSLLQASRPPLLSGMIAVAAEVFFDSVFFMEALLRCISCPHKYSFLQNEYNVIDILAALPLFLRLGTALIRHYALGPEGNDTQALVDEALFWCVVPILRLLKTLRRFTTFQLLRSAFKVALEGLPVLIFTLLLMALLFSSVFYIIEPRSNVDTLPTAVWFSIVTITTVGYGDVTPSTLGGHIVASVMALCGVLYMAMPISIIGHAFTHVWENRKQILLTYRTRESLIKYGYTADNIPQLFELFDDSDAGVLDLPAFKVMMQCVRIGLSKKCAAELFKFIDKDGDGTIDCREFLEHVFQQEAAYSARISRSSTVDTQRAVPRLRRCSTISETQYMDILEAIGSPPPDEHREDRRAVDVDDASDSNEEVAA